MSRKGKFELRCISEEESKADANIAALHETLIDDALIKKEGDHEIKQTFEVTENNQWRRRYHQFLTKRSLARIDYCLYALVLVAYFTILSIELTQIESNK